MANNYLSKYISLFLLLIGLSGCATTMGPAYSISKAKQNKDGYAILYVYREYAEPTAWGATIVLDGKEVTTLAQGGYTWVYITPGNKIITAEWPGLSGQRDSSISLLIEPDKEYYLELIGSSSLGGIYGGTMIFQMGSGLILMDPEAAKNKLINCCNLQEPISNIH